MNGFVDRQRELRAELLDERLLQLPGEGLFFGREFRRAHGQQVLVQQFRERGVGDQLVAIGLDVDVELGAGHQRRPAGDVVDPAVVGLDVAVCIGADEVPDGGLGGHDVRGAAAVGDDVVEPRIFFDVLSHVVDADVHQFDGIEGAASAFGTAGRMRRRSVKGELHRDERLGAARPRVVLGGRMPVQAGVEVFELSGQQHVDFTDDRFFGRRAIEPNCPFQIVFGHGRFDSQSGPQRAGAESVVTAGVSRRSGLNRLASRRGFLRHAGQRVVLGQDADDRGTRSETGDESGRHAGHAASGREAGFPQLRDQQLRRPMFLESKLGVFPDRPVDGQDVFAASVNVGDGRQLCGTEFRRRFFFFRRRCEACVNEDGEHQTNRSERNVWHRWEPS